MDPVEGCVEINGTPVPKYDWSTLAYRMSVMFQDFARFNVTLRQEIGLGSVENIDNDAALLKAVEAGGATPVVSRVPLTALLSPFDTEWKQKYRDIVPDTEEDSDDTDDTDDDDEKKANGGKDSKAKSDNRKPAEQKETKETNLSGGEWQRVALARAFMGADRADLVVFDEPTSALDPRAEAKLFDTLLSLSSKPTGGRKCTTIFISHQFGNVRRADKIAFMEKGVSAIVVMWKRTNTDIVPHCGRVWDARRAHATQWQVCGAVWAAG
jgi:ABC-type multidrug transport system fused ATPase/permease subunit